MIVKLLLVCAAAATVGLAAGAKLEWADDDTVITEGKLEILEMKLEIPSADLPDVFLNFSHQRRGRPLNNLRT